MNYNRVTRIIFITFFIFQCQVYAQNKRTLTDADKSSLEGIIVEKYYTYNSIDVIDTLGGCLPKGSVTYRIYIDLKTGYTLQAVYGVTDHPLYIKTTTLFFNNTQDGQGTGDHLIGKRIIGNTAAFDSWITMGAATESDYGIPKADDKDGSILKIASLDKADGLIAGKIKPVTFFGITPNDIFNSKTASAFITNNGSWAMFGGIKGPTEGNKILIAQITTDGKLSFQINLQVGTPTGGTVNYVATNPQFEEIKYDALTY